MCRRRLSRHVDNDSETRELSDERATVCTVSATRLQSGTQWARREVQYSFPGGLGQRELRIRGIPGQNYENSHYKRLGYRPRNAVTSVKILSTAAKLYEKSHLKRP